MPRPGGLLALIVTAMSLTLSGCSQADTAAGGPGEVAGGAVGPDRMVTGDLSVLQVQIEYPLDGAYEKGEDAGLFLGIANTGNSQDELLDVRGPDFADARILVDGEPGPIPVRQDDNVYVGAEGAPTITLVDLERPLRSSQSIPVTLVFQDAGEVTVDVPVAAEGQDPGPTYDFPDPAEDPTQS